MVLEHSGVDRHTDNWFTEKGGTAGYVSTDAGGRMDVLVGTGGSSLLTASVFSVKEARTPAEKEAMECRKRGGVK